MKKRKVLCAYVPLERVMRGWLESKACKSCGFKNESEARETLIVVLSIQFGCSHKSLQ